MKKLMIALFALTFTYAAFAENDGNENIVSVWACSSSLIADEMEHYNSAATRYNEKASKKCSKRGFDDFEGVEVRVIPGIKTRVFCFEGTVKCH